MICIPFSFVGVFFSTVAVDDVASGAENMATMLAGSVPAFFRLTHVCAQRRLDFVRPEFRAGSQSHLCNSVSQLTRRVIGALPVSILFPLIKKRCPSARTSSAPNWKLTP